MGQRKSGTNRRPVETTGRPTPGRSNPPARIRSRTMSYEDALASACTRPRSLGRTSGILALVPSERSPHRAGVFRRRCCAIASRTARRRAPGGTSREVQESAGGRRAGARRVPSRPSARAGGSMDPDSRVPRHGRGCHGDLRPSAIPFDVAPVSRSRVVAQDVPSAACLDGGEPHLPPGLRPAWPTAYTPRWTPCSHPCRVRSRDASRPSPHVRSSSIESIPYSSAARPRSARSAANRASTLSRPWRT